ncbi:ATP-dependent DNA helicase PIF1-like protein [Tanacetum coccineum]
MMHNYQDAMDLCRAYGNPNLFITFTSNPKWVEIFDMLAHIPGQKSHDRPEIGTRVFKMKLTELMDDLTKRHVFRDCCAVVYVIEFQKRGLPHAHILLWLEERFKCTTPDEINDIIAAELPSLTEDPDGYKVVSEFMLHGPCGKDAKYAPCTIEGKCLKHYPKVFLEETVIDEDGYLIYRRQNNKVTAKKGKFTYNNQHVVPYNSRAEHAQLHSLLNPEQRTVYDKVIESVYSKSGIASLLMPGSRTANNRFVIPLELVENSTCGIKQNTHLAELMQQVKLVIWDEAPMTRRMRVNEYNENGDIDTRKQDFNKWVLVVGDGRLSAKKKETEDEPTWIEIPEDFLIRTWRNPIEQIVLETYLNFITRQSDESYLKERAILTPRNDDADAINEFMFKKLGGASMTYHTADEICKASTNTEDQHHLYPV